jgi:hypothetical protein
VLQYKTALEPVPFPLALAQSVLAAQNCAMPGLLWFDWLAIARMQKIADEHELMASVAYARGSAVEQDFRGKNYRSSRGPTMSISDPWSANIIEAYGFPKAEQAR